MGILKQNSEINERRIKITVKGARLSKLGRRKVIWHEEIYNAYLMQFQIGIESAKLGKYAHDTGIYGHNVLFNP